MNKTFDDNVIRMFPDKTNVDLVKVKGAYLVAGIVIGVAGTFIVNNLYSGKKTDGDTVIKKEYEYEQEGQIVHELIYVEEDDISLIDGADCYMEEDDYIEDGYYDEDEVASMLDKIFEQEEMAKQGGI